MGSPDQLIESNADYLVLTLQSVDERAFEIIAQMGFEPEPGQQHQDHHW
jgi:hypothetical protein